MSGQKIVSVLQARKIAQEEVNLSIQKHIAQLELDKAALTQLEQKIASGISYEEAYTQSMSKASAVAKEHAIQTKGLSGTTDTFIAKQKVVQAELEATSTSSKLASVGVKALSIAFNMFTGMAIIWGVTKIIEGFEYLSESAERAKEKLAEIQTELSDNNSTYQTNRNTLVGLKEEYDVLTKKVESLGGAQNLANDEYERYQAITSQILGITPKLTTGWDEEGKAISNKNNLLQASIDLLDEEYEKSLRNNTTKSKNEYVASGVIVKLDEFNNSVDTTTKSGTIADMRESFLDELEKLETELGMTEHDIVEKMWVYFDPKADPNDFWSNHVDTYEELRELIAKDYDKLGNSFVDENNPIYELFSDEVIRNMIRNANEYFAEEKRILDERELLYQDFKDQLNWNAQAVGDAYSGLDEQTKAGITQMIDSFDYNDMTKEKFSDMATDLKDFVGKLSNNDTLRSYFNNLFKPMGEDESIEDYESRVKTGIDEITSYCENNYPAIKLSFGDVEKDVEKLQKQYDNAITKTKDKFKSEPIDITPYQEALDDEYQKIQDWGLEDYANKIKNGTIQSVFGNVDMDKRTIITWSDELKQTYADALASWDYDPEVGSIDTVFGGSSRFGEELNGVGWEVAFTPILPDGTFLSQDAVYDYINTILEEAYVDDGKVTEDELVKIDAQGRQIGNTFVQGIFAGIDDSQNYDNNGNWAETVGRLMHFSGDFGAVQIAKDAIEKAKKQEADFDWDSWFKENSINTQEEIDRWNEIAESATNAADARKKYTEGEEGNKADTQSFEEAWKALDDITDSDSSLKETKEELLELAKAGELTAESFKDIEGAEDFLKQIGLSAEETKAKILGTLDVQEKLSAAHQGLEDLTKAYEEFKDIGFATAQTLESLPDSFKKLKGYNLFEEIVGNPKSGAEAIQQAFNDITKEYLLSQDTLGALANASENEIQSYIANLKQMGISNAEEVVAQTQEIIAQERSKVDQEKALMKETEQAYLKYLQSKDKADLDYLRSIDGKNSQLAAALGKPYETDYNNFCELLEKKAKAYNDFITALGKTMNENLDKEFEGSPYSEKGLADAKAKKILNDNKINSQLYGRLGMQMPEHPENVTKAAKQYIEYSQMIDDFRKNLSFDFTTIGTDFTSSFNPTFTGDKSSNNSSDKDTKETFDWIETEISRLTKALDTLKTKADNTYASWTSRNTALSQAISKTEELIRKQSQAYNRYMKEANSVGLSSHYKNLVQNGAMDISKITDETLKEKIKEYQTW